MKVTKISLLFTGLLASTFACAEYSCEQLKLKDCPTIVDKKIPDPHDMLTWTQQQRVIGFRNSFRSYDGSVFHTDKKNILALPKLKNGIKNNDIYYSVNGKNYNLNDYIKIKVLQA